MRGGLLVKRGQHAALLEVLFDEPLRPLRADRKVVAKQRQTEPPPRTSSEPPSPWMSPIAEATASGTGERSPSSRASASARAFSSSVRIRSCCQRIPRLAVPASTGRAGADSPIVHGRAPFNPFEEHRSCHLNLGARSLRVERAENIAPVSRPWGADPARSTQLATASVLVSGTTIRKAAPLLRRLERHRSRRGPRRCDGRAPGRARSPWPWS